MKRKGGVRGNQNNFEETERVICVRNFMLGKSHLNISAWYIYIYIFCFVSQRLLFCYWKQTKLIVSFFNSFGWVKKVDVISSIVKGYELTTTYKTWVVWHLSEADFLTAASFTRNVFSYLDYRFVPTSSWNLNKTSAKQILSQVIKK